MLSAISAVSVQKLLAKYTAVTITQGFAKETLEIWPTNAVFLSDTVAHLSRRT